MAFSSIYFIFGFLPIVLVLYFLIREKFRIGYVFIISALFYVIGLKETLGTAKPALILAGAVVANYLFGLCLEAVRDRISLKRTILIFSLITNIGLLFVFKYLPSVLKFVNNTAVINLVLPVGISFFTFKEISYILDIYRGVCPVERNFLKVAVYISFFPQLTMGPIVQFNKFREKLDNPKPSYSDFYEGVKRFILGLAKKVIIADGLAKMTGFAFSAQSGDLSVIMSWMGAIGYTLQLFFDFSGYTDMAIGISRMLGFGYAENFNYPYMSSSITDFWRRWHISLSTWFRDYLYFPLGGSRVKSKYRHIFNLLIVWCLTGIWHGSGLNFIAWGLIYFILLVFEKYVVKPDEQKNKIMQILYRVFTLLCVVLNWVIFNAGGLKHAIEYIASMFGLQNNLISDNLSLYYLNQNWIFIASGVLFSTPVIPLLSKLLKRKIWSERLYDSISPILYLSLMVISIAFVFTSTQQSFIYFKF